MSTIRLPFFLIAGVIWFSAACSDKVLGPAMIVSVLLTFVVSDEKHIVYESGGSLSVCGGQKGRSASFFNFDTSASTACQ